MPGLATLPRTSDGFTFGRFDVQAETRELLVDGEPAKLGARAFDVLLALIERRERAVSKNELLELVWPGRVVEENNLQVHISALRKLLGPTVIATIPGRGYHFTEAPGAAAEGGAAVAARAATAHAPSPATPPAPASAPVAALVSALVSLPPCATAASGNLPTYLPPLFGRDDALAALRSLIGAHPLITVVGAAGMGKTTLALAAAQALRGGFRDGAWLVELASITDPTLLPQAVAQALRITLAGVGAGTAQQQLVSVLGSQAMLLVLDNCEHMVDAAGSLAEAIVAHAPGVRLLATSQERLNVANEKLFKLDPLALPAADEPADAEQFGALGLFAARAQAVDPRFELNPGNAEAVADICRRLDGLPLAIELAAARVRLLGVHGLRDKLGERFRVLTGGARTAMRRHQTLHAAIDWSHALLSPPEQAVLRRLGVFVGGFTLELAQQLAGDPALDEWAVLDALSALVERSLVAADAAAPPRYRLLESTRAYALEKLADAGETAALTARHARAICALFVQTEEARFGELGALSMADLLQRLAPELDNLRSALDWLMGDAEERDTAVALAGAAAIVYRFLGLAQEGLVRMQALQGHVQGMGEVRAAAIFWQEFCAFGSLGRLPLAAQLEAAERAQRIYRQQGLRRRLYRCLCFKAWALNMAGQSTQAQAMLPEIEALEAPAWPAALRSQRLILISTLCTYQARYEESLALLNEWRALLEHEPGEELSLLTCLSNLCVVLSCLQRHEEAAELARSLVARHDGFVSGTLSQVSMHLMRSLVFLGRFDEAEQILPQSIAAWRRDGMLLYVCPALALLLAQRGRHVDAARLDGAGAAFVARNGVSIAPMQYQTRLLLQRMFDAAAVTPADIERWQREGAALDEAAVAALCQGPR